MQSSSLFNNQSKNCRFNETRTSLLVAQDLQALIMVKKLSKCASICQLGTNQNAQKPVNKILVRRSTLFKSKCTQGQKFSIPVNFSQFDDKQLFQSLKQSGDLVIKPKPLLLNIVSSPRSIIINPGSRKSTILTKNECQLQPVADYQIDKATINRNRIMISAKKSLCPMNKDCLPISQQSTALLKQKTEKSQIPQFLTDMKNSSNLSTSLRSQEILKRNHIDFNNYFDTPSIHLKQNDDKKLLKKNDESKLSQRSLENQSFMSEDSDSFEVIHDIWDNDDPRLASLLIQAAPDKKQEIQEILHLYKMRYHSFPGLGGAIENEAVIENVIKFAAKNKMLFKKYFPKKQVFFNDQNDYAKEYDGIGDDNYNNFSTMIQIYQRSERSQVRNNRIYNI